MSKQIRKSLRIKRSTVLVSKTVFNFCPYAGLSGQQILRCFAKLLRGTLTPLNIPGMYKLLIQKLSILMRKSPNSDNGEASPPRFQRIHI